MPITESQAEAFLDSLYPEGHMSNLATHTRSFFAGLLGDVPKHIPRTYDTKETKLASKAMAQALREIARHLDVEFVENLEDELPF